MKEMLKILFDLSFYYTLSGFYLYLFTQTHPSPWGVSLLILSACAFLALKRGSGKLDHPPLFTAVSIACCALPAVVFAFNLTFPQVLQLLPAWAFVCFTLLDGRIYTTRSDFKKHFKFTAKLFAVVIPGFFVLDIVESTVSGVVSGVIPYLIVYFLAGICLMRILREEGKLTARRNIIVLQIFLVVCIAFTVLQGPQYITLAMRFLYWEVLTRLIVGVALVIGVVFNGLLWVLAQLLSIDLHDEEEQINFVFGEAEAVLSEMPAWFTIVVAVFITAVAVFLVFLAFKIIRKLLGRKNKAVRANLYTEELERLEKSGRRKWGGIIRPKDPREAVRWYYRKYLKEGISRGAEPKRSDTSLRILDKYSPYFPDRDPGKLRDLYILSRYRFRTETAKHDADAAASAWRDLKAK